MLYRLTCRSGMRLVFRAGQELINPLPSRFHRRSHSIYLNIWKSESAGGEMHHKKSFVSDNVSKPYQCWIVEVQAYAEYPLCGSILRPRSMSASERINWNKMCRPLVPLKVFHIIPLILRRVGALPYKDTLFTLTCQRLRARCSNVFLSSPHTNLIFVFTASLLLDGNREKSTFLGWTD